MSVRSAIKALVVAATGYDADKVVASYHGGPAPSGDRVEIGHPQSMRTAPAYLASETYVDGVLTRVFNQPVRYVVSVDVYASDGWDKLDDIVTEPLHYEQRGAISDEGLTLVDWSDVRPLTEYGDTVPEWRFQRDLFFDGTKQRTFTDYSLDLLEFEGEFVDDATGISTESYSVDLTT